MVKKAIVALLLVTNLTVSAQEEEKKESIYTKPSRDYVMLQFGYDGWLNAPDSLNIGKGFNRSFNAYLCYDFPIKNSNLSFAAGAGISTSNIYFKDQNVVVSDSFTQIHFVPSDSNGYWKKYKLSLNYLEAPFEIRYFGNKENRNKGFKAALGMKVGALVNTHTKGKRIYNSKPIIEKESTKRYIETYRFSATARIGWGNITLYGQYGLNGLFRVNNGPENVRPYSFGICVSGL